MAQGFNEVTTYSVEQLEDFLLREKIPKETAFSFVQNLICGEAFAKLTETDLRELCPLIGVRTKIRKILRKVVGCEETSPAGSASGSDSSGSSPHHQTHGIAEITRQPLRVRNEEFNLMPVAGTSNWQHSFQIPEKRTFSGSVVRAVDTGVVSAKARREIVQMLRTLILQHTSRPTGKQYTGVVKMLVEKYPKLVDEDDDSGFGDWKMSLRNSFKNWRRDGNEENQDGTAKKKKSTSVSEPPSKRMRMSLSVVEDYVPLDDEEYEDLVGDLAAEWRKDRRERSMTTVKNLFDQTSQRRRSWITSENPLLSDILDKYPCLASSRVVRRDFRQVFEDENPIQAFRDEWPNWKDQVIKLARIESESRPLIKKILKQFEAADEATNEDSAAFYTVELVLKLLYPRGPASKEVIFMKKFTTCDINLTEEVRNIRHSPPYVVITGDPGDDNAQYFVCSEQSVLIESKTFLDVIIDMMSCYYVFDISYPQPLFAIFLFFQHFVFKIRESQTHPPALSKLIKNLKAV